MEVANKRMAAGRREGRRRINIMPPLKALPVSSVRGYIPWICGYEAWLGVCELCVRTEREGKLEGWLLCRV